MTQTPNLPVIGVGASAGGLEALGYLFQHMPTDTGAAFVIIQHLSPSHESLTAEILSRHTSMPTAQVTNGLQIEANHVYVIPPSVYLTLEDHRLVLSEPVLSHGLRMPIDAFFWSLAEQTREKAVAIIVSGTGSDGTLGLQAIKGHGGLVLVQSPETAQYDGMLRSAIATGLADHVCPVEEMAGYLTRYLQHPYVADANSSDPGELPESARTSLRSVLSLLQNRTGYDFGGYKLGTLGRRIDRRMGVHHVDSVANYLEVLRTQDGEPEALLSDLLIGVTSFFRDSKPFETLDKKVIEKIAERKRSDESIRVWVPACSSGEEAYSIAMLFLERLDAARKSCRLQVFATDLNDGALTVARNGAYPENVTAQIPPERLRHFFAREDHSYRVVQTLRESVTFAVQNVITDPPFSRMDLISCRNLLIYLTPEVQQRILALFHFALLEGGYLILGHSESASQQERLFNAVDKKHRIYRRASVTQMPLIDFPSRSAQKQAVVTHESTTTRRTDLIRLKEVVHQHLVNAYAPAAVLLNSSHQLLYYIGPTYYYLVQPTGAATHDLLTLALPELRTKLRGLLKRELKEAGQQAVEHGSLTRNTVRVPVTITATRLISAQLAEPLLLLTFEEGADTQPRPGVPGAPVTPVEPGEGAAVETKLGGDTDADPFSIRQLEQELTATREELQSHIEEQESANEELQAANEEVMSVNEELQSTNEELETSKEELQSMNEELTTVNNQLKDKVEELAATNDDLINLLSSTDIATLFLDSQLRIGRFTPAAQDLLNVINTDVGRPFRDLKTNFPDNTLQVEAARVLNSLTKSETELASEAGRSYLVRIVPYRTADNRIDGVVMAFIDITERKKADQHNQLLAAVVRDSNDAIVVQTLDGSIIAWNRGAVQLYGWSEQEALSRSVASLIPEAALKLEQAAQEKLASGEPVPTFETDRLSQRNESRRVLHTMTRLNDSSGQMYAIASTDRDITDRLEAEAKVRSSMAFAEKANASKTRFLAAASHDLRQPLQSLTMYLSVLARATEKAERNAIVLKMQSSLTTMRELLDALLDVSKLQTGAVLPEAAEFSLSEMLDRIAGSAAPIAQAKALQLHLHASPYRVCSDRALLQRIVENFVSNAISYTDRGQVEISTREMGSTVRIEVRDTGKGIPSSEIEHIFEEYYQLENRARDRSRGLGLGLFIASELARLLAHPIGVDSSPGAGSTFWVDVPATGHEVERSHQSSEPDQSASGELPGLQSTGQPVLLVDDEASVLDAISMSLTAYGYRVLAAGGLDEALMYVDEGMRPVVIVSDYRLPMQTGLDVIKQVRERMATVVPAILLTGDTAEGDIPLDGRPGIRVLRKPVDSASLLEAIADVSK